MSWSGSLNLSYPSTSGIHRCPLPSSPCCRSAPGAGAALSIPVQSLPAALAPTCAPASLLSNQGDFQPARTTTCEYHSSHAGQLWHRVTALHGSVDATSRLKDIERKTHKPTQRWLFLRCPEEAGKASCSARLQGWARCPVPTARWLVTRDLCVAAQKGDAHAAGRGFFPPFSLTLYLNLAWTDAVTREARHKPQTLQTLDRKWELSCLFRRSSLGLSHISADWGPICPLRRDPTASALQEARSAFPGGKHFIAHTRSFAHTHMKMFLGQKLLPTALPSPVL